MLRDFFAKNPQVYVAGEMNFYYEPDNPKAVKTLDVFVVKGVLKHKRGCFKRWEEHAVPNTIFEIISKSINQTDLSAKFGLYGRLGVREYFLFDPLGEHLKPRLRGYSLVEGHYQPISSSPQETLLSLELGLILFPERDILRLIDISTGELLPTSLEALAEIQQIQLEKQQVQQELEAAKTTIIELQAELKR
jgi:Uma2 family endonuclease